MALIKIKDNLICAVFDITDIARIKVAFAKNEVKQVFVKTTNGAIFEADADFYRYCLERMTELNIFIDIEKSFWVGGLDVRFNDPFR